MSCFDFITNNATHGAFPWVVRLAEFFRSPYLANRTCFAINLDFLLRTATRFLRNPAFSAASSRRKCAILRNSFLVSQNRVQTYSFTIEVRTFFLLAIFRVSNPKNQQGLLNVCRGFLLRIITSIVLFDFTASPSVFTLRFSASGGKEPFSEEKGSLTSKKTFSASRA